MLFLPARATFAKLAPQTSTNWLLLQPSCLGFLDLIVHINLNHMADLQLLYVYCILYPSHLRCSVWDAGCFIMEALQASEVCSTATWCRWLPLTRVDLVNPNGKRKQQTRQPETWSRAMKFWIVCFFLAFGLFRCGYFGGDTYRQSVAILGTYIDKSGYKRFVGNPKALKASQNLGLNSTYIRIRPPLPNSPNHLIPSPA